ncbi:MAG: 5'/3'-nucleotidase SurE [Candidatus Goldiibacteriota bacterium]
MKKKYYVIISNDDGIFSAGIRALYEALEPIAEVLIAAPDRQRSGASHAISVDSIITAESVPFGKGRGFAVSGTPADCAKLALFTLAKRKPDLFISGINHGPNMAQFILYSGTVGAAAEAAILGIPAMAFSVDDYKPEDFSFCVSYIRQVALNVLEKRIRIKKHSLLNINIPYRQEGHIKGVKMLPKGLLEYGEKYILDKKRKGKNKSYFWHITGRTRKRKGEPATDADGLEKGYITVTSLSFDLNDRKYMNKLGTKGFEIKKGGF